MTQTDESGAQPQTAGTRPHRGQTLALVVLQSLPLAGLLLVYYNPIPSLWFWLGIALIAALGGAVFYARHAHRMAFFEEALLAQVFLMSLVGIGLTNFSPRASLRFWIALSVLIAMTGLVLGVVRAVEKAASQTANGKTANGKAAVLEMTGVGAMIGRQIVHWGATLATIGAVYQLFLAGRLNYESTGLVLLLVLGLATFLDGVRISWRYALIGLVIGATSVLAGFVNQYLWLALFGALALLALVVGWEWLRHRRNRTH